MPGIVGLIAFIFTAFFGFLLLLFLYVVSTRLFRLSKPMSWVASSIVTISLCAYMWWQSFGFHEWHNEAENGAKYLPELVDHDARFIEGYRFIDGLSEGEVYKIEMAEKDFELHRATAALEAAEYDEYSHFVFSTPSSLSWIPSEPCTNGKLYIPNYPVRAKMNFDFDRSVDSFSFYVCPDDGYVYAGNISI